MIGEEAREYARTKVWDFLGIESRKALYFATCRLVGLANITLSGVQTVDGAASTTGDIVFAATQTDPTEVGLWVANNGGAWTRSSILHYNGLLVYPTAGTQANILWSLAGPQDLSKITFGTSKFSGRAAPSTITTTLSGDRNRVRLVHVDTTWASMTVYLPSDVVYEGMEFRFIDSAPATSWMAHGLTVNGNGALINNAGSILLGAAGRTMASLRHNGASYTVSGV